MDAKLSYASIETKKKKKDAKRGLCMSLVRPCCRAWQVFSFLQLNAFMEARGYTFFLVCLYVMIAGLALNVALCFWVSKSFANNSFGHVW